MSHGAQDYEVGRATYEFSEGRRIVMPSCDICRLPLRNSRLSFEAFRIGLAYKVKIFYIHRSVRGIASIQLHTVGCAKEQTVSCQMGGT